MNAIGPAAPDERELMRSFADGSTSALGALVERTEPILYPLALRIVGSRERAAAVLEDLFEEIWRDRARWRGSVEIPTVPWIARCRELALAFGESRRPATEPLAPLEPGTPSDAATTAAAEIAREAFACLPEIDRVALEEVYFRGANAREVASLIGAPTSDAAARLRNALVRFRECFAEREAAMLGIEAEDEPLETRSAS